MGTNLRDWKELVFTFMGEESEKRKKTNVVPGTPAKVRALGHAMSGFKVGDFVLVFPGPVSGKARYEIVGFARVEGIGSDPYLVKLRHGYCDIESLNFGAVVWLKGD